MSDQDLISSNFLMYCEKQTSVRIKVIINKEYLFEIFHVLQKKSKIC